MWGFRFMVSKTPSDKDYDWCYILPSIEYRHKFSFLWQIAFTWWRWGYTLDIIRTTNDFSD